MIQNMILLLHWTEMTVSIIGHKTTKVKFQGLCVFIYEGKKNGNDRGL